MKKITLIVPDDATGDMTALLPLIAVATEFKIEPAGGEEPVAVKRRSIHRGSGGSSLTTTIMDHYTPEGMFHLKTAIGWCVAKGYAATSTSGAISALRKDGYIGDVGQHKYKFLKPLIRLDSKELTSGN